MTFRLPQYQWLVHMYFLDKGDLLEPAIIRLERMGAPDTAIIRELLRKKNKGVSFSRNHESVVIIGRSTDAYQLANTLIHERKHLESDICKEYGISPYSEEAAYLAGDIGAEVYDIARGLLCQECREKPHRRGRYATI